MKNNSHNLFINPTKKQVLYFFILWLIGVVLLLLVTTDLFTKNPFKRENFALGMLAFSSTISMLSVVSKYYKNKRQQVVVKG
jgi:hypothetical protein